MAHLIRDVRFLAEHGIKKLSRWGNFLLGWLKKLFRALHGRNRYTSGGFALAMEQTYLDDTGRM